MTKQTQIRNFAIVAHIDHGKSTLADRLLEATGTVEPRLMKDQYLDSNPIERERGITIKLAPVRMKYEWKGEEFILNLIDTPGHVDFSYEVSRSLSACEGIVLVVDASQGIQAQTVAHMQHIKKRNLSVIPVVNKIDLPLAKPLETKNEMREAFGFKDEDIIMVSAKTGQNIDLLLQTIIQRVPPPEGDLNKPFKALVFSSVYDTHKGVLIYIKVIDGKVSLKESLHFFASSVKFFPVEIGIFAPHIQPTGTLSAGQVGYIATGLKDISLARVGDTVSQAESNITPFPGYQEPKPMVFLCYFPTDADDFPLLREALEKLHLSDGSFTYKLHSSPALGKGYLCGFLGLLHAEVVKERLNKEFGLNIIATAPSVEYQIYLPNGEKITIQSADDFPESFQIREIREPVMLTTIYTPNQHVGAVMQLCQEKRAEFVNLEYIGNQAKFTYVIPLSEMIIDFFDRLKSVSLGYASLDYELYEYKAVQAVKLEILINKKTVEAFSQIIVVEKAQTIAQKMVEKLKDLIPRHQFQIPIQAAIGNKIIARSDIKSFRKDVTSKLYGGDRTRKDKLLEAQKKGKKKMRQFGNVTIPQDTFLEIYKTD